MHCSFCDENVKLRGTAEYIRFVYYWNKKCRECLILLELIPINRYNSKEYA